MAAELRITLDELTRLVQTIAEDTRIYLNNAPGGGLFTSDSYIAIAAQQFPLAIKAKTRRIGGSDYAYYVNDMQSASLRITPINGALRLTVTFESNGPEAVAGCFSGDCPLAGAMPDIEWTAPAVSIDFIPIQLGDSISLKAKSVRIAGVPRAVCKTSATFFAKTACNLGLPLANYTISRLKADLPKFLQDQINQDEVQQKFAEGLKKHLSVGQAGVVAISSVSIAPKSMTVNFRFSSAAGN
jgi:hypothetical protein